MKTSKIFRAAKAQLWDGEGHWLARKKDRFVCHAIDASNARDRDKLKAKRIVDDLLGEHETWENWLFSNHQIKAYQDMPRAQETRRAWLDHLIEHYESLGD
jgi:hypothetical protein